jgi:hypothetical protein
VPRALTDHHFHPNLFPAVRRCLSSTTLPHGVPPDWQSRVRVVFILLNTIHTDEWWWIVLHIYLSPFHIAAFTVFPPLSHGGQDTTDSVCWGPSRTSFVSCDMGFLFLSPHGNTLIASHMGHDMPSSRTSYLTIDLVRPICFIHTLAPYVNSCPETLPLCLHFCGEPFLSCSHSARWRVCIAQNNRVHVLHLVQRSGCRSGYSKYRFCLQARFRSLSLKMRFSSRGNSNHNRCMYR